MTGKSSLILQILAELRKAQASKWEWPPAGPVKRPSFPPILSLGDGRSLPVTDALVRAVSDYNQICWNNDPSLKLRFKIDELFRILERSFGLVLSEIDLDNSDQILHSVVNDRVQRLFHAEIARQHQPIDLALGCHLIERDHIYPIAIGPVIFETRELWRNRMLDNGKISPTTALRLAKHWQDEGPKRPIHSADWAAEGMILDAVAQCPVICTVSTDGLASRYVQEKGLLAARLAITAVSLIWQRPSEGLKWMKLLYDRALPHRRVALLGSGTNVGANYEMGEFPAGRYFEPEMLDALGAFGSVFDIIGAALFAYVQPTKSRTRRATMNALFLSLWWFHEACREPQDQIATTMFAASMDALAGGRQEKGILELIESRLGPGQSDPLMKDGRTAKKAIEQIYKAGRSQLIHGTSEDFAHDWTHVRCTAELIGRLLIIECCNWFNQNLEIDDLSMLRSK
jgi:hypothetical protein